MEQEIGILIHARDPNDYSFFVERDLTSREEIERLKTDTSDKQREKYNQGVRSVFERKLVAKIFEASSENPDEKIALQLVQDSIKAGKTHIALEILSHLDPLRINMPLQELESIVRDSILGLACGQFSFGVCVETCPYNMIWNESYNCNDTVQLAYNVIKKYFDLKTATKALGEILR